jgi:hypothetical protein
MRLALFATEACGFKPVTLREMGAHPLMRVGLICSVKDRGSQKWVLYRGLRYLGFRRSFEIPFDNLRAERYCRELLSVIMKTPRGGK